MSGEGLVELARGPFRLRLDAREGGSIARFDWSDGALRVPILRGCEDRPENILSAACFPLVPFVNRIRDGRFTFRGRKVMLKPNMPGDPSPLHGQGWLSPWQVESQAGASAELSFRHEAGEWPWDYEARQHFRLNEDGLAVRLACRNRSSEPMPCGLGLHPYFPCAPGARLDSQATSVWTIDEHVLPVEKVPATGRYDLTDRPACGQDLDHGFGGWSGSARILQPSVSLEIILSSPDARFFQLYSPAEGGVFVAEPVTHANAALNAPEAEWAELGLRILEPDDEMTLDMRLDVRQVSPG